MIAHEFEPTPESATSNSPVPSQRGQENYPHTGGIFIPSQHYEEGSPTLLVLPGAWHGLKHFERLKPEINKHGIHPLTAWMSIDNAQSNYSDWADEVAEQAQDYDKVWALAHSRKGNLAPLLDSRIPLEGIIYLNGVIPGTQQDQDLLLELDETVSKHLGNDYYDAIEEVGDLLHFNQDTAGKLFFADLSLKDQEKYAKALRPMRARKEDIILPKRPDTREYAIIGLNDLVLNPDWQEARAEITIGEDAIIPMESGHSPFLSHPEELGKVIFGIMQDHT